jgi:hypothetical protein
MEVQHFRHEHAAVAELLADATHPQRQAAGEDVGGREPFRHARPHQVRDPGDLQVDHCVRQLLQPVLGGHGNSLGLGFSQPAFWTERCFG